MSWSVSIPPQHSEEFVKAVEGAHLDDTYNKPELVAQWGEQLEAAKRAAAAILSRDAFGHGGLFSASLGGHARHGKAGEGTDYTRLEFVNVTVSREPGPEEK